MDNDLIQIFCRDGLSTIDRKRFGCFPEPDGPQIAPNICGVFLAMETRIIIVGTKKSELTFYIDYLLAGSNPAITWHLL